VCKQVLCFIFRAEEDEPDKRPPYELTERQQSSIEGIRDAIRGFLQWKADQGPAGDGEGVRESDESDEEIESMSQIQREILRLWMALLNHQLQDNEYKSLSWREIANAISRRFCRENRFEDESGKWDPDESWDEDNVAGDDP
jgi:hypothetical protein